MRLRLRHREDPATHAELDWSTDAVGLPAGLEIEWLGTAGFRLTANGTTIAIDPYLSRAPLRAVLNRAALRSDPALVTRHLPSVDAVLVGHTHFDHAVDVPTLAADGATVYGSSSARHLLGLHGLADRSVVVEPHRRYEIGPFVVSFVPSVHSKLIAGWRIPSDGELTCDCLDGLGASAYRCGQVWGIRIEVLGAVIYHQGSADLLDDEVPSGAIDVFLCGIAGRGFTPRFVDRVLKAVDPSVIVAQHHDDFFRPLDDPMGFSFNVNLGGFVEDVARAAPHLPVRTLRPLRPLTSPVSPLVVGFHRSPVAARPYGLEWKTPIFGRNPLQNPASHPGDPLSGGWRRGPPPRR